MQNNNGHDVVIEEEGDQVVIGEVGGDGEEGGDQEVIGEVGVDGEDAAARMVRNKLRAVYKSKVKQSGNKSEKIRKLVSFFLKFQPLTLHVFD